MSDPAPAPVEIDCRGKRCPTPVIELAKAMARAAPGATVWVTADDPAAAADVAAWCRLREQEFLGVTTADDGVPRYGARRRT